MSLKDNLKRRRNALNLTLEDVAKVVGVSRQTIQKYETGVISNAPSDKIELLAKALNTTPAYLMGWEKKEQPSAVRKDLSEREMALLELFDQMPEEKQEIAFKMIQAALGSK